MPPRIMLRLLWFGVCVIGVSIHAASSQAQFEIADADFSGRFSAQSRWFPQSALFPDQKSHATGFALEYTVYFEDAAGRILTVTPFYRYDSADDRRNHFDLWEAYGLFSGALGDGEWELRLGIDRVFWGVAESRQLVDIVNQIDLVEHPDEKTRMGQPMAYVTWSADWGVVELLGMPFHRVRTSTGSKGRLRGSLIVDEDRVEYESDYGRWHPDFAARYSHTLGPMDFGLSAFDGTAREPALNLCLDCENSPALYPLYERIRQFGLDAQWTTGSLLLKLEAIRRSGARNLFSMEETYNAFVLGGEYTFFSLWDSAADLTLFAEWDRDGRGRRATSFYENDLFAALRLTMNDVQGTEVTANVLYDLDKSQRIYGLEIGRRLTDIWSLDLGAVAITNIDPADLYNDLRQDSFVQLNLNYHF